MHTEPANIPLSLSFNNSDDAPFDKLRAHPPLAKSVATQRWLSLSKPAATITATMAAWFARAVRARMGAFVWAARKESPMLTVESASLARLFPDVASGRIVRPRLPVLRYRSLDERESALSLPPEVFRWHMRQLIANDWRILGTDALLGGLDGGGWLARSAAITFDEGYRNFNDHALAILHGYAFATIVFVACNGPRAAAAGQPPLLDWSELRDVAREGITIGLRVPAEPDLRTLPLYAAESTLAGQQSELEDRLGQPVTIWAHAYGRLPGGLEQIARRHFRAGFGARLGTVRAGSRAMALERVDARLLRDRRLFRALGSPWLDGYLSARQAWRDLRARSR